MTPRQPRREGVRLRSVLGLKQRGALVHSRLATMQMPMVCRRLPSAVETELAVVAPWPRVIRLWPLAGIPTLAAQTAWQLVAARPRVVVQQALVKTL
ncbi:hypothetical protein D9M72_480830 [compost metagenome]